MDTHVLVVMHVSAKVEVRDFYDEVLFMCSLAFVIDTAGEMTSYGKLRRYPPAVMQTLWVLFFCGHMVQTWFA